MIKLYNGDCVDVINTLVEAGVKVDAIITDPPYNIARDNNFETMGRQGIDFGEWDKNADIISWIASIDKILNKNGSVFIFNAWRNLGDIAKELENNNIVPKDMFRFIKTNPMPRNRDRRYITDYECAIWLTNKNAKWVFNRQDGAYQRPVFRIPIVSGKEKTEHTTQKPVLLMEELVKIHSNEGQVVLDAFMGSDCCFICHFGRPF